MTDYLPDFRVAGFGGWPGSVRDACDEMKAEGRTTIPNYFVSETSYLSESMDVFLDQNSAVHGHYLCSNASKSGKNVDDFYKSNDEGAFVSQEVVKDFAASADPLCSMVPCSISAENGDLYPPTNNDDGHQALVASKSLPSGAEIAQTSSGHHDENVGNEEDGEHDVGDPLIRRQLTSLKTHNTGMPENSTLSFKWNFNCGSVNLGENNAKELSDSTDSPNDKDIKKKPLVRSISNCTTSKSNHKHGQDMRMLSVEQHLSCINTSEKGILREQPPIPSIFGCTNATNNAENHVENAFGRFIQDHCENNAEKGVELQVLSEDIPTSPLVLCHRNRRFEAPKLHISNVPAAWTHISKLHIWKIELWILMKFVMRKVLKINL